MDRLRSTESLSLQSAAADDLRRALRRDIPMQSVSDAILRFLKNPPQEYSGLDAAEVLGRGREISAIWEFLTLRGMTIKGSDKIAKPSSESVLSLLVSRRLCGSRLTVFIPWGYRYKAARQEILADDPEAKVLSEIREVVACLGKNGYSVRLVMMPADYYAIGINGANPDAVYRYYASLSSAVISAGLAAEIMPWSEIKQRAMGSEYRIVPAEMPGGMVSRAEKRAEILSTAGDDRNAKERGMAYLSERRLEADVVISKYGDPLKISLAEKGDDVCDGNLKRVYVIRNTKPWMGAMR